MRPVAVLVLGHRFRRLHDLVLHIAAQKMDKVVVSGFGAAIGLGRFGEIWALARDANRGNRHQANRNQYASDGSEHLKNPPRCCRLRESRTTDPPKRQHRHIPTGTFSSELFLTVKSLRYLYLAVCRQRELSTRCPLVGRIVAKWTLFPTDCLLKEIFYFGQPN